MKRISSTVPKCLLVLGISLLLAPVGWSADSKEQSDISKRIDASAKVLDEIMAVKDKAIRIEGHTDNVPIRGALTAKYATNWELSAARAINVTRFLQKQGLDPMLLTAAAYGEYKPVAPNDSDEGKAKNRRIEIVLVAKE